MRCDWSGRSTVLRRHREHGVRIPGRSRGASGSSSEPRSACGPLPTAKESCAGLSELTWAISLLRATTRTSMPRRGGDSWRVAHMGNLICWTTDGGMRVRQRKDYSITVDLENDKTQFIAEGHVDGDRKKLTHEKLTAKETSLLRSVLGAAGWEAQQTAPRHTIDVSSALSHATTAAIGYLLETNQLVRGMRKTANQQSNFHRFSYDWDQLWAAQRCDASDELRPDGSKTTGLVTGLTKPQVCSRRDGTSFWWHGDLSRCHARGLVLTPWRPKVWFSETILRLITLVWAELHEVRF